MQDRPVTEAQVSQLTQESYAETPYEDASWEVVGQCPADEEFLPMDIEVINSERTTVDPMFADYGGLPTEKQPRRWHLPEELAVIGLQKPKEDAPPPNTVTMLQEDLEKLKQEIFQQGQQEGNAAALAQYTQERKALETKMTEVVRDLQKQFIENLRGIEKNALDLSLAISKKIINFAVDINPEYILQITQEAIGKSGAAVIKRVRVSPEDMEFIQVLGLAKEIKAYDGTWDFEADPTVKSGCVVETSAGEVDFQLDKAWERVRENVLKVVR